MKVVRTSSKPRSGMVFFAFRCVHCSARACVLERHGHFGERALLFEERAISFCRHYRSVICLLLPCRDSGARPLCASEATRRLDKELERSFPELWWLRQSSGAWRRWPLRKF